MKTCLKIITKLLFCINLIPAIFALSCDLNFDNNGWTTDWHLLLTKDNSNNNNQFQLLRERSIPVGHSLHMFCGRPPNIQQITVNCGQNQQFDRTLPLPLNEQCSKGNSVQPVRVTEKTERSHCQYNLYKIGFHINGKFYETYQVCFDDEHMRPVFTINKAYPYAGERPKVDFNNALKVTITNAFKMDMVILTFKKLLGEDQTLMYDDKTDLKNSKALNRGHLSPSADFVTTVLKNSTFSLINVAPTFRTIDNGNWQKIERWSRDSANSPANICTGVLDCNIKSDKSCILQLKHSTANTMVPIFLGSFEENKPPTDKIPVPLWIYKIVKSNKNKRFVFLTLNNIHSDKPSQPPSVCREEDCPTDVELDQNNKDGFTFCCQPDEFINRAVPKLKDVC